MLGWNISVYRLDPRLSAGSPDSADSVRGRIPVDQAAALPELTTAAERIAVWQADVPGIRWLDALVDAKRAIATATNGYPSIYYAVAADVMPRLEAPPHVRPNWHFDAGDILHPRWEGKTVVDAWVAASCASDEWLLVEVWDES